jgi:hypothetical protein
MTQDDDIGPDLAWEAGEVPEPERDPEIGPQEATWADTEDALFAVHWASVSHGPEARATTRAAENFEVVQSAYERAQARGWAAQEAEAEENEPEWDSADSNAYQAQLEAGQ